LSVNPKFDEDSVPSDDVAPAALVAIETKQLIALPDTATGREALTVFESVPPRVPVNNRWKKMNGPTLTYCATVVAVLEIVIEPEQE
jgi:hypothetical protein